MGKYCIKGDKAKVYYSFGGGAERVYKSDKCPIDVIVTNGTGFEKKSFSFDFGQNTIGASFSFKATPPKGIPKDYEAWILSGSWDNYGNVGAISVPLPADSTDTNFVPGTPKPCPGNCGKAWSISGTCTEAHSKSRPETKSPTNCSFVLEYRPPNNAPQSEIKIVDATGQEFKDKGKSPCKFRVQCAGDCPDGQCRMEQSGYPGYCCMDTQAIKNQINSSKR